MDSDAKLDKCGVCNGNNETCMDIEGTFRPEHIERAKEYSQTPYYYHVAVIPKGASNIEIKQPGRPDDLNYIGEKMCFFFRFFLFFRISFFINNRFAAISLLMAY